MTVFGDDLMNYHFILIYLVVFISMLGGYAYYLRKTRGEVNMSFIMLSFSWPLSIPVIICLSPLILLVLLFSAIEKTIKRVVSL